MTILQISAVQSGVNHDYKVFGLVDDNKVYFWLNGTWSPFAGDSPAVLVPFAGQK